MDFRASVYEMMYMIAPFLVRNWQDMIFLWEEHFDGLNLGTNYEVDKRMARKGDPAGFRWIECGKEIRVY